MGFPSGSSGTLRRKLCYPHSPADEDAARQETFRLTDSDWMFTHAIVLDAVCLGRAEPEAGALRKLLSEVTPEEWDTMHAVPNFIGVNSYNGSEIAGLSAAAAGLCLHGAQVAHHAGDHGAWLCLSL